MKTPNASRDLLVVGSVAYDSVETPQGSVEKALGGSASFASIAASYYCHPMVVGIVGTDFEDRHMRVFETHGVDTRGVERKEGKTFHWRGRYHGNFKERDTLETALNVFESFDPRIPPDYRSARYVFLGNIAPSLQMKVLDQAGDAEMVAMDTMNFWIETARDELMAVLRRVNLLFINDEEAFQLTDERSLVGAAERILTMGPRYVVVKRGEYGAVLFGSGLRLFVPAVLLRAVVDPTGAGDTFAGGFVGRLAGSGELDRPGLAEALLCGTVMASFAVEAFSVEGICGLTREAIDSRRAALERMIRI